MNKQRLMDTFLELCRVESVSGSRAEAGMPDKLAEVLRRIPYFQRHPENIWIHPIQGDSAERSFIFALQEGYPGCKETVILLSHFDVVGVEEFGAMRAMAFDPVKFTQSLRDENIQLPAETKEDLDSGDYLFGRGTMDMKFGIAASIETMYQVADNTDRCNILFVSVPDEEANSAGMLAAVHELLALKEEKSLEYKGCLVTEPYLPDFPGDEKRYIYTGGAVGKVLPVFYCVGRETHACEPFSGLNPNLLTAALVKQIEQNPELADEHLGSRVPAPICLKQSDLKLEYSVQSPKAAYAYFSFMTLKALPDQVLSTMKDIAVDAFRQTIADIKDRFRLWQERMGGQGILFETQAKVLTYQELYHLCLATHGEEFQRQIEAFIFRAETVDQRELSLELVREVHSYCPDRDPMIIVFLAPPYYPHVEPGLEGSIAAQVGGELVNIAREEYGETLHLTPYFPGISDMSYLRTPEGLDLSSMEDFPLWGKSYRLPMEEIAALDIPFLNVGPHGKDPHKLTERINVPYSFNIAAPLIYRAVQLMMTSKGKYGGECDDC